MTHYFSKVVLRRGAASEQWYRKAAVQGTAYRDHAVVWRLFPGDDAPRDFIFRAVPGAEGELVYYVVSARRPDADQALFSVESKLYQPRLAEGQQIRFTLRANPTISRGEPGKRSKRHDVLMDAKRNCPPEVNPAKAIEEAGHHWLLSRAERWGLAIREGGVAQDGYQQHRLVKGRGEVRFSSLDYDGVATVTDPDRLLAALCEGVGHGKGFGCGLLMIRKID